MEFKIYALTAEQALELKGFMLPSIQHMPDKEKFWYFAAASQEYGFLGLVVVAPYVPEAELLSIAVSPAYTRRGIATELLSYALEKVKEAGLSALRMTYALPPMRWNTLDGLMKQNGFVMPEAEKNTYVGSLLALQEHPILSKSLEHSNVCALQELTELEKRNLLVNISEKGEFDPSVLKECSLENSFVWKEDGEIQAAFLLSSLENGQLTNLYTWLESNSPKKLIAVMQQVLKKAVSSYPMETEIIFSCMNEASEHLVHYFLPDAEPVSVLRTYWHGAIESVAIEEPEVLESKAVLEENEQQEPDAERIAYWNDAQLCPVDDSDLYCHNCIYRTEGDLMSCKKYKVKPGEVMYGAPCKYFEKMK